MLSPTKVAWPPAPTASGSDASLGEAKARTYFDSSPEYLILVRLQPDGGLVYEDINPAAERILGRRRADVVGAPIVAMTIAESAHDIAVNARLSHESGRTHTYQVVRKIDGNKYYFEVLVAPVALPGDQSRLVLFSGRDVTEQRETEDQLRQSQKMEAIGQMTGGLAHDFNNLLTGISCSLDMIRRRVEQRRIDEIDRHIAIAQDATARAAALTRRLLDFSRRQTLEVSPTDVGCLVSGLRDLILGTIGRGIVTVVRGTTDGWLTRVDRSQLENAILNLCINARDAMPDGGRLDIATAAVRLTDDDADDLAPGDYVSLSVSDTGTGMSADVRARVFEPFFTTKPAGIGTGLGLSMIFGFVRQSNGGVRLRSVLGAGTTFTILLPRDRANVQEGLGVSASGLMEGEKPARMDIAK